MPESSTQKSRKRNARLRDLGAVCTFPIHCHPEDKSAITKFIREKNTGRWPDFYVRKGDREKSKKD